MLMGYLRDFRTIDRRYDERQNYRRNTGESRGGGYEEPIPPQHPPQSNEIDSIVVVRRHAFVGRHVHSLRKTGSGNCTTSGRRPT